MTGGPPRGRTPLAVTLFADFACPYSYLTEAMLWAVTDVPLAISARAYELHPAPEPLEPPELPDRERARLESLGRSLDLMFGYPDFRPRTRKAHEASLFAREHGRERELRRAIYEGYWSEGRDVGRIDVLVDLADRVGLDADRLQLALDVDRYGDDVLHDRDVARRLRVPGTPTLFLGAGADATVLVGATERDHLEFLITRAARRDETPTNDG